MARYRGPDSGAVTAKALWYIAPGEAELRMEMLPPLAEGYCRLRMLYSSISRGTEALILDGLVPQSEWLRMRCPHQLGEFPHPVKYGYQAVARVEAGPPGMIGKTVFALHPHQDIFDLPMEALALLPDDLPPRRAVLAANMETALNAVWDGGAAPGDRIAVIGAGVVGALAAVLSARLPGTDVTLIDLNRNRAELAFRLGIDFALPDDGPQDCDVVFHASGHSGGLGAALQLAGDEATIVEMSWHGAQHVPLPLGEAFHARRLKIVSSQVGRIPPVRSPRWDHRRRLDKALELLDDGRLDALLEPDIDFADLPSALPRILGKDSGVMAQVVSYQE